MRTRYTVARVLKDDITIYGNVHNSMDTFVTLCGKDITDRWKVLDNEFDNSKVTCKKCLKK